MARTRRLARRRRPVIANPLPAAREAKPQATDSSNDKNPTAWSNAPVLARCVSSTVTRNDRPSLRNRTELGVWLLADLGQNTSVRRAIEQLATDPSTVWSPAKNATGEIYGSEIAEMTYRFAKRNLRLIMRRQKKHTGEQLSFDDLGG